jgi:hypothetical protein
MLYVVEITPDNNLGKQLSNMRTWLDHTHSDVVGFRRYPSGWRVDFESESAAREFARAFYGRLLNGAGNSAIPY